MGAQVPLAMGLDDAGAVPGVVALAGISPRRFVALLGPVLGKLSPVEEIPRPRLPRGKVIRLAVPAAAAMLRRVRASQKRMPEFLASAPGRCEMDRDTFVRRFGHRGPHEVELSIPRAAEDPAWIDEQLAALRDTAHDADALLASQEAARAAAWVRLAQQDPKKVAAARKLVARWAPVARDREAARSEVARSAWVVRTWVRRAGELTGHGDDLFFLALPETADLLRGDPASLADVPARRATYETYRALPPYPALIRGRFDPIRWAADPTWSGSTAAPAPSRYSTGHDMTAWDGPTFPRKRCGARQWAMRQVSGGELVLARNRP